MKLLLALLFVSSTLFAGGYIAPKKVVQKGCYKPKIKKCPDCDDVAVLCPDDPKAPIVEPEPCQGLIKQEQEKKDK